MIIEEDGNSGMIFKVDVLLNDVHLELEDDDHDVIHAVSSSLSFKVGMKKLVMSKKALENWRKMR